MEEIKIGEYIRVDNGIILRYDFIQKNNDEILLGQKGKVYSFEDEEELEDFIKLRIVKHSKNIIDLIQCGDYVNGYLVLDKDLKNEMICLLMPFNEENQSKFNVVWNTKYFIKSILTKELFEQHSYRL